MRNYLYNDYQNTDLRIFPVLSRMLNWSTLGVFFLIIIAVSAVCDGSVLDYAEVTVSEQETNDSQAQAQDLSSQFAGDILAVGVEGSLSDSSDVDFYRFNVGAGGDIDLKFEMLDEQDHSITAIAAGIDGKIYFVADNDIWRKNTGDAAGENESAEFLVSAGALAEAVGLDENIPIDVRNLAIEPEPNGTAMVILGGAAAVGGGNLLAVESDGTIVWAVTADEIADAAELLTAQEPNLVAVAVDGDGLIYLAEQVSKTVLIVEQLSPGEYAVSRYTESAVLLEAIERDVLEDLTAGNTDLPRTVVAQTEGDFQVNALVYGDGDFGQAGFDVYYLSQLGPNFNGDGGITQVSINQEDANDVVFSQLFEPNENQEDINPSALALDVSSAGIFGNQMFMGTFGPSLGDDFDGRVFTVDIDGNISDFVTSYQDSQGQPVLRGEQEVDGFFDVTDMAFSYGGAFGQYLYVVSENINNGDGFSSDIWRIGPDGVAELFVSQIADGVISLVFGTDGRPEYGNALYVATFQEGGRVLKVTVDGLGQAQVEDFFDYSNYASGSLMISDMAFVPAQDDIDNPLEGLLVLTLKWQNKAYLLKLDWNPLPNSADFLALELNTGDVSSGDIAFNDNGDLIVAQQTDKNLLRLNYQDVFDFALEDLQIRQELSEGTDANDVLFTPYAQVTVADQPRILRLSDSGLADDIVTEVNPRFLDIGEVPEDLSKNISFIFDNSQNTDDHDNPIIPGQIYLWVQNDSQLYFSERDEEGQFDSFQMVISADNIESETGLIDAQIARLAWTPQGNLFGLGFNGTEPESGQDPPSQRFDDTILSLVNTIEESVNIQPQIALSELSRIAVNVLGPGEPNEFVTSASTVFEEKLENLPGGDYFVQINSLAVDQGDYELLIALDGDLQNTIVVSEATGPQEVQNTDNERLVLTYSGPGQASLLVNQKPSGKVIDLVSLTISGSTAGSMLSLKNLDNPANLMLEELILSGSLGRLEYPGTLIELTHGGQANKRGIIKEVQLGSVRDVDAPGFSFLKFHVDQLGDADLENRQFNAELLSELEVTGDVNNMTFFAYGSLNRYRRILVGGVVRSSAFYGRVISQILIQNNEQQETAFDSSFVDLRGNSGMLGEFLVEQGDVVESGIFADKLIFQVEITRGNLDSSDIYTFDRKGKIYNVIIGATHQKNDQDNGHLINSQIYSPFMISRVRADGQMDQDSRITANQSKTSRIDTISCGGDCGATISTVRLNSVLVGFDRSGSRIAENGDFTGSDFTGSITASLFLKMLNVTGLIENAQITASGFRSSAIFSIFAEDGFVNSSASAYQTISRIMVGYLGGYRVNLINSDADASGTITTSRLGRFYYTGDGSGLNLNGVRYLGPVVDDVTN
ncbi:MAG: hypothetical protein JXD22_01845 [Sedimentisphaerales bacterium]|nr:hypothetical protein [Sedimentisphaerales bacterium]